MKKIFRLTSICIFAFCCNSYASNQHDSVGKVKIKAFNIWDSHVDIYLADDQQHQCSGGLKTRFLLDPADQPKLSAMLLAYASGKNVSLAYNCGSDNYPWVVGMRIN